MPNKGGGDYSGPGTFSHKGQSRQQKPQPTHRQCMDSTPMSRRINRPQPLTPTVDAHCKRHALRVHSVILPPRDRKWVCAPARATARQIGDVAHLGVRNGQVGKQRGEVVAQGETIPWYPHPSPTSKARQTQSCQHSADNQLSRPCPPRFPRKPIGPKKCPAFQLNSHGATGGIKMPLLVEENAECMQTLRPIDVGEHANNVAGPTNGRV
eukprot:gene13271-biopygen18549